MGIYTVFCGILQTLRYFAPIAVAKSGNLRFLHAKLGTFGGYNSFGEPADTIIRVRNPRPALTGDTRIQLIDDGRYKIGTVNRWKSDGKLHEKTAHGWKIVGEDFDPKENKSEEKRVRKIVRPLRIASQKEYDDFIDKLFDGPTPQKPDAIRLPLLKRKLMQQVGLDERASFLFQPRYYHVSPARKAAEGQDLRKEEYKKYLTLSANRTGQFLKKTEILKSYSRMTRTRINTTR